MITVDELRAAGALDVPAAWRKSLGVERDLFGDLFKNEDPASENREPKQVDSDAATESDE